MHQMMILEHIKGKHLFRNLGKTLDLEKKRNSRLSYNRYIVKHKRWAVSPHIAPSAACMAHLSEGPTYSTGYYS